MQKKVAGEIPWNFAKFLVNDKGEVVKYWGPRTSPNELMPEVLKILEQK